MWSKAFWKGATERAVKTFAQTAGAAILVFGAAGAVGFYGVDWVEVVSVSGVAAVLSILTSVTNAGTVTIGTEAVTAAHEAAKQG